MSPSRLFILRPVATSLLMVGVLLVGMGGVPATAGFGAAGGRLSDDSGGDVLSGRRSRCDGVVGHGAAGAAVRAGAGTEPDDLDQFVRQFGHHAAVRSRPEYRRGGAAGAGGDQCGSTYLPTDLPNPPIYSKVNPADAPILTLALTSDSLPLSKVEDLADTALAQKISQLPGVGLVSISGGQKPAVRIQANPTALASYGLSLEDLRDGAGAGERGPGQGRHRRSAAVVHHRRQRSAAFQRAVQADCHRLSQRRAGAAQRCGERDRRHGEHDGRRRG